MRRFKTGSAKRPEQRSDPFRPPGDIPAYALRNIHDKRTQQDVMYTFIYCYNEMLIRLVHHPDHGKHVYHIDARGTARKANDWFDEMHLSPAGYKQIAAAFHTCITDTTSDTKVYKVRRKTE